MIVNCSFKGCALGCSCYVDNAWISCAIEFSMIAKQSSFDSHFTNPQKWFCPKNPFFSIYVGCFITKHVHLKPTTNACFHSPASVQVKVSHLNWDLNTVVIFLDFRLQIGISQFKPKFHNFVPPCGNHTSHDTAISFRSCSCSFVWITLLSCLDYHVRFFWLSATYPKQVERLSVPYLLYCSIKTLTKQRHMGTHGKYNYHCACEWIMPRKKAKQPSLYLWFYFFD